MFSLTGNHCEFESKRFVDQIAGQWSAHGHFVSCVSWYSAKPCSEKLVHKSFAHRSLAKEVSESQLMHSTKLKN